MTGPECGCFPAVEELAELAGRARAGEVGVAFVGDGAPDTTVGCEHGSWRLGDLVDAEEDEARPCSEPGCPKDAAKNRKWCPTHASPKNRKGDG